MLSFIEVLAVIVVFFPLCLCFICISYQERLELLKYDSMGVGLYIYLLLVFLIHLVFFVYAILLHSLQLLGYFNNYYIKYTIVPRSWIDSIRAYHVNKHLGILTPRHERLISVY
jgi:hypothetical protein